jgi:hypothetical protein
VDLEEGLSWGWSWLSFTLTRKEREKVQKWKTGENTKRLIIIC